MYKELVINNRQHETRVAFIEDGTIVELFIERRDNFDIAGNIYKGKVQRVLPGMQAAFVDIGLGQSAFIHVNDLVPNTYNDYESMFSEEETEEIDEEQEQESENELPYEHKRPDCKIEDVITEGQEILVQVAKSPIGTKGARITSNLSLPGRFLVLMPNSDHVGISRRIETEEERYRLKDLITELREGEFGYIARTASEGVKEHRLSYEMGFLSDLWATVQKRFQNSSAPKLLHKELDLILKCVRDLLTGEADKLIIDSYSGYQEIVSFIKEFMPSLVESVTLYDLPEPIFDHYNLEVEISRALKRSVWLKSGAYIIIEQTEALCAIDINTGRYVGKHNLEETILKTNLEAVKEIAYQIRLRDIGGIIIIDFIDMEKKSNQEKVFNALVEALQRDRSKTNVLPISEMGLIQMTRKRIKKSLNRILCEPCFYCGGEGYLMSKKTIAYNVFREVLRIAQDMMGSKLTVHVNREIANFLHNEENNLIAILEKVLKKPIVIYPNQKFHLEQFEIMEIVKNHKR